MKSSASIRYKHAFNSQHKIIYIGDLTRSAETKSETFICISCGNVLIPKLGQIKQKHFAHKHIQNCSEETYLHKLAKLVFEQEYYSSLINNEPFFIELEIDRVCNAYQDDFGRICNVESINKLFDLTKRYKRISPETRSDEFIPDILLSDKTGEKNLFIEIAVTHQVTEEKISSKTPIIEINIETEEDIFVIKERIIRQTNPKIKLINLEIKPEEGRFCDEFDCPERVGVFRVYKNGKSILTWEKPPKAKSLIEKQNNSGFLYFKVINGDHVYSLSDEYKKNLIEAYNNKIDIKNCFLCRYHGENWSYFDDDECPIFCKFLKVKCKSNYASECQYYKPDQKSFPDL
ncbi:hypothetical protein H6F95_31080 [Cyanobacteria bacterium FACHB-471]|nr:hypothetical protein [Cyanobacteria bacterium FACHB-471]